MTHIYSHTFEFETLDKLERNTYNNNIISIIEEDAKKHYINFIHYKIGKENTVLTREINIKVDRSYYLEIANVSIDNDERKKRLLTIIGKRCFGLNDNKLDIYFFDDNLDPKYIYKCFEKHKSEKYTYPILHEIITHTTNRYEAYPFYCNNSYFAILKQTNISTRKTFSKTFLVQMDKSDHTKLLTYQTNELKIEYIFNLIGKVHFISQPLQEKIYNEIEYSPETIINKKLNEISDGSITNHSFLNKELYSSLKSRSKEIENIYFSFLSRGLNFIHEPNNKEAIFLFEKIISESIELLETAEPLEDIVSFLEILKIIVKEKKISYLMEKKDQDIKDIFIFMLETVTSWNTTLNDGDVLSFNRATIDLYNILQYFIDKYFKFYYDYKSIEALSCEDQKQKSKAETDTETICSDEEESTSAKEFCAGIEIDYALLDELSELQSELESCLYANIFESSLIDSSQRFLARFAYLLNSYYELQNIGYIVSLINEQVEKFILFDNSAHIIEIYKTIIEDLVSWKEEVFIEQSSENIHSLDDILYVKVAKMDMILEGEDITM